MGLDFLLNIKFEAYLMCSLQLFHSRGGSTWKYQILITCDYAKLHYPDNGNRSDFLLRCLFGGTKWTIPVLTADQLNMPGIWHLKFQTEEETKYICFSFDRLNSEEECVCTRVKQEVNVHRAEERDVFVARHHPLEIKGGGCKWKSHQWF